MLSAVGRSPGVASGCPAGMRSATVRSGAGADAIVPEGPEIRRAADRIARVLVGERIESAELTPERLHCFAQRLTGARVRAVDTRGKAMLTRFDNDLTLYSHNQLYGRWFVVRRGTLPRTRRSLRVALHTARHSALLYSASDIEVLTEEELREHSFLSRLGPLPSVCACPASCGAAWRRSTSTSPFWPGLATTCARRSCSARACTRHCGRSSSMTQPCGVWRGKP